MSGEDLKMWPVRPREDAPYLLGRVCAVLEWEPVIA